ncbi:MAG: thioesterase family protein [Eubacteriales bacterium]|jgi:fluoroacetyl-CoA thioesterase
MSLQVGLKHKLYEIVTDDRTAKAWGSGTLPVYATPSMVLLMERTSVKCVEEHLEEGETTVGIKLDISHVSASPVGMTIYCESELVEIDRKRLVFRVKAYDEVGKVGEGIHERFIVDAEKFMKKTDGKRSN